MEKKLKDYLPMYLGCDIKHDAYPEHTFILNAVQIGIGSCGLNVQLEAIEPCEPLPVRWYNLGDNIRPSLLQLHDLTEDQIAEAVYGFVDEFSFSYYKTFNEFFSDAKDDLTLSEMSEFLNRLRKLHFDVDGLIECSLATRKTLQPA